jgi:hypothetical protein
MSIATFSELSTAVANYLARSDLTDQIPDFIRFAELRLRRELRIRQMLKSVTTTTTSGDGTVEIPSDFLEARDFYVTGNPPQPLTYLSPSVFIRNTDSHVRGKPLNYTILATEFQLLYYSAPTFLSSTNSSNAFMANSPDALLYAALLEAEPYIMNDARIQTWATMYQRAIDTLVRSDESAQYSGVPLAMTLSKR